MWVEKKMSGISEEYLKKLRRLVYRYPEIAVYIIEELIKELGFSDEQKEKIVREAITNWKEAGSV